MLWVADTGPLLHLAEAGSPHLLPLLGEVMLPPAVQFERAGLDPAFLLPKSLNIVPLSAGAELAAEDWCKAGLVHRGEAHAISLARQIDADYLLTDDAAARLLATTLGLRARGSLGVILWLAGQRLIPHGEAAGHLDRLAHTSLWVGPRVLAEARAALNKISGF